MKNVQTYDVLKNIKHNLYTVLQLMFGLLAGIFLFNWLTVVRGSIDGVDPFYFLHAYDLSDFISNSLWLQLCEMLLFIACLVCFFVFGFKSDKKKRSAYDNFLEHREFFESESYLKQNDSYYRALVNDYLKVNSCFYERKGKVKFLYRKMTSYLYIQLIIAGLAFVGAFVAFQNAADHGNLYGNAIYLVAIGLMVILYIFMFYYMVVKHRKRCFQAYAIHVEPQQIRSNEFEFDASFMEYIANDAKLAKRADKMQKAGQNGIVPYIFSEPVTGWLLGGAAIEVVIIIFIVSIVISIVTPNSNKSTVSTLNIGKEDGTNKFSGIVIYGHAGEVYEISSYHAIMYHNTRTEYEAYSYLDYIEIRKDSAVVGWLRNNGSIDYANDYKGDQPFARWERR